MDDRLDIVLGLLDKLTVDHIQGADDQRLKRLEALTYHWQQLAAGEISRRKQANDPEQSNKSMLVRDERGTLQPTGVMPERPPGRHAD
jgi:hypothetical protein